MGNINGVCYSDFGIYDRHVVENWIVVMKKTGMKRLYVGDVGFVVPPVQMKPLPPDVDLETLSYRELFSLAVECGIQVKKLIGIKHCYEHVDRIKLNGPMPEGYNLAEHVVYCENCWSYWRVKRK